MKRKDCKKENRYECKTQDLSKVADILNEIIISGQVNDTETSIEDSWVDIIDNYTSGMALGTGDTLAYARAADVVGERFVSTYFRGLNCSIVDANNKIKYLYSRYNLQRIFIDTFYTLMGQLENEFEWMKPSLKAKIKRGLIEAIESATYSVFKINLDSIYYTMQFNAVNNNNDPNSWTKDTIEAFISPYVNSTVNEIVANTTMVIYDAFYSELITEVSLEEFDYICQFIKPYLVDFRDDILKTIICILYETMRTRVTTTYQIHNQVKEFTKDLDIPYYGY